MDTKNSNASEVKNTLTTTDQKADLNKSINSNRRRTFLGVGSASLLAWQTPLVETVILPAHAQTSIIEDDTTVVEDDTTVDEPPVSMRTFFIAGSDPAFVTRRADDSLLDYLVPSAVAGVVVDSRSEFDVSILEFGSDYEVNVLERRFNGDSEEGQLLYAGSLIGDTAGDLSLQSNPCSYQASATVSAQLESVSDSEAVLFINDTGALRGFRLTVPAGSGTLAAPSCNQAGESFTTGIRDASSAVGVLERLANSVTPSVNAQVQVAPPNTIINSQRIGTSSSTQAEILLDVPGAGIGLYRGTVELNNLNRTTLTLESGCDLGTVEISLSERTPLGGTKRVDASLGGSFIGSFTLLEGYTPLQAPGDCV